MQYTISLGLTDIILNIIDLSISESSSVISVSFCFKISSILLILVEEKNKLARDKGEAFLSGDD